jgi:hypothetical protein
LTLTGMVETDSSQGAARVFRECARRVCASNRNDNATAT